MLDGIPLSAKEASTNIVKVSTESVSVLSCLIPLLSSVLERRCADTIPHVGSIKYPCLSPLQADDQLMTVCSHANVLATRR